MPRAKRSFFDGAVYHVFDRLARGEGERSLEDARAAGDPGYGAVRSSGGRPRGVPEQILVTVTGWVIRAV